jgi:drug/metabolite transporter (DMT)-like permease
MSDARQVRRAAIVMVVLVAVWGYAWVLSKLALSYCGPLDFAALRITLGAATLLPALLWLRRPLKPKHFKEALFVGVVQTALFLLLNNWALAQGEAGKTSVLVFTMPFWVLVFAWPILGERIEASSWVAVLLAAAGLVFILAPWGLRAGLLAKVLAVLAGVCWALGVVLFKRLHNRTEVDVLNFTFWQMVLGLVPMAAIAAATHTRPIEWTPEFIGLTLFLGILATGGGWMAWFYVLRRMPAGTTSMSSLAIPVIAIASSALQLGERPGGAELTGMVLVGAALGIVSWDMIRKHREVEPLMGQE